jgi:hypothetical protein
MADCNDSTPIADVTDASAWHGLPPAESNAPTSPPDSAREKIIYPNRVNHFKGKKKKKKKGGESKGESKDKAKLAASRARNLASCTCGHANQFSGERTARAATTTGWKSKKNKKNVFQMKHRQQASNGRSDAGKRVREATIDAEPTANKKQRIVKEVSEATAGVKNTWAEHVTCGCCNLLIKVLPKPANAAPRAKPRTDIARPCSGQVSSKGLHPSCWRAWRRPAAHRLLVVLLKCRRRR